MTLCKFGNADRNDQQTMFINLVLNSIYQATEYVITTATGQGELLLKMISFCMVGIISCVNLIYVIIHTRKLRSLRFKAINKDLDGYLAPCHDRPCQRLRWSVDFRFECTETWTNYGHLRRRSRSSWMESVGWTQQWFVLQVLGDGFNQSSFTMNPFLITPSLPHRKLHQDRLESSGTNSGKILNCCSRILSKCWRMCWNTRVSTLRYRATSSSWFS